MEKLASSCESDLKRKKNNLTIKMGADFSNSDLEWAKPKDMKMMDTEEQWIRLCIMSPE